MKKAVKRYLFNFFGGTFLLLGIAGIILPLLPATPFLLLSAYCFSKGSREFHHWLIHHKHLGAPIRDWEQRGVIRLKIKILATVMMIGSGLYMLPNDKIPFFAKGSFVVLAIGGLSFIWTRPSH